MTAAVTLDDVSCVFGHGASAVRAVDGVSLAIEAGEDPAAIGRRWQPSLRAFMNLRAKYLLY